MGKGIVGAQRAKYANISDDTLIKGGPGLFWGFYVNSTSSGTIVIYDALTGTGTKIHNTITPAIGPHVFPFPVRFETGLFVDKTGGSIDLTVFFTP